VRPAGPGERALDVRRVSLDGPPRRARRERADALGEQAPPGTLPAIARRPREVGDVGELVDRQQFAPVARVADEGPRRGRHGPEEHGRAAEERVRGAVRGAERVVDHDVGAAGRGVADHSPFGVAHGLEPPRDRPRPGGVLGGGVHAEVRRLERSPVELGPREALGSSLPGGEDQGAGRQASGDDSAGRGRGPRRPAAAGWTCAHGSGRGGRAR
jgi:hypothetical protein